MKTSRRDLGGLKVSFLQLITKVINDAASLLGCSVGMADDLTAITLVALGTSLPDPCLCFAYTVVYIKNPPASVMNAQP